MDHMHCICRYLFPRYPIVWRFMRYLRSVIYCKFNNFNITKKSLVSIHLVDMAPRIRQDDPPEIREIALGNVPGQGLGYKDKDGKIVMVADVNLQLIGT